MGDMMCFALYLLPGGERCWAGPFPGNVQAREAVPAEATASIITRPIPLTTGEGLEARPILRP